MEILQHGKQYDPMKFTCKKCGCVFKANKNDIGTTYDDENGRLHNCQVTEHKWVKCPECQFLIYIK